MVGDPIVPDVDPGASPTLLVGGMVQLHEIYQAAVDAGFSEQQAMSLVLEMVRVAGKDASS